MNKLDYDNFELLEEDLSYQLAAMHYSFSEIFNQFFLAAIQKQKNSQKKAIYKKWPLLLLNIWCNNKMANILLLSTLAFNKKSINRTIEVFLDIAGCLELTDNIVKSKVILLKRDLLTIRNARRAIYWR